MSDLKKEETKERAVTTAKLSEAVIFVDENDLEQAGIVSAVHESGTVDIHVFRPGKHNAICHEQVPHYSTKGAQKGKHWKKAS